MNYPYTSESQKKYVEGMSPQRPIYSISKSETSKTHDPNPDSKKSEYETDPKSDTSIYKATESTQPSDKTKESIEKLKNDIQNSHANEKLIKIDNILYKITNTTMSGNKFNEIIVNKMPISYDQTPETFKIFDLKDKNIEYPATNSSKSQGGKLKRKSKSKKHARKTSKKTVTVTGGGKRRKRKGTTKK